MSLWRVAWRSIQQRALASGLTALSMGLGVALVVAVLVIYAVVEKSFGRGSHGCDLIVGAKGGKLELVLNSVFYLGSPVENIPYDVYEEFTVPPLDTAIESAIPICMGHDYKGVPVVATVPDMFYDLKHDGKDYEFARGKNFEYDDIRGAVVGWEAARKTDLDVGDTFQPGAKGAGGQVGHKDEPFTVRGVLDHSATPNDNAIFINMEGFFLCPSHRQEDSSAEKYLEGTGRRKKNAPAEPASEGKKTDQDAKDDATSGHQHEATEDAGGKPAGEHSEEEHHAEEHAEEHEEHDHRKEVSAVLICTDIEGRAQLVVNLASAINDGPKAQAVQPALVISDFFQSVVGNIQLMLLVIAVLVVIVAGIGIMVSIYNSMSDRKQEIAVMRALGASRWIIMVVILMESILLSLGGGVLGVLLGHGLIGALSPTIYEETGVLVSAFEFQWVELILVPGLIILATAVGYLPAVAAYQTDVAKSLSATQ